MRTIDIMKKLTGLTILLALLSCDRGEGTPDPIDEINTLTVSETQIPFFFEGGSATFEVGSEAGSWEIITDSAVKWITLSQLSGETGTSGIGITANRNNSIISRATTLLVMAADSSEQEIRITQEGALYRNFNTDPLDPDSTGMEHTAMEIAAQITAGWNAGNTLEAIGGETNWGNPQITQALIHLVKENGFNAVRLPCSWDQYTDQESGEISEAWMNRVKEVIQYCINEDVYVILNIHWDGGWLENNCTEDKVREVNAKQRALWQQIATHLRDFDEHLLFAGANEPNVDDRYEMNVLESYHQSFVDAVRSTGGKNSYRVLVVQGPSTDVEKTNNLMSSLPTDVAVDRMMAEIHYYTPYQFCLMGEDADWGKMFYYWGADYHSTTDPDRNCSWGEESGVDYLMGLMNTKFIAEGIPVILGEYCVAKRASLTGDALELHLASRAYYLEYVTRKARENGILPFYWDAGGMGNMGSALFNRNNNTVYDQRALDSVMAGIGK
ncbi:MAG: cellulase family glycosylhydrolase [Bacteroidales bacterium]|nr:cellulase family glycosylhydrolase [Bacteroidales bacterium]